MSLRKEEEGSCFMEKAACVLFLVVCAAWDVKKWSFPVWLLLVGTLVPVAFLVGKSFTEEWTVWLSPAIGCSFGLGLYLAGRFFQGSFGSGDAWLMADTGLFLGWEKNLLLWWNASVLALLFAGILVALGKGNRKTKLPMAPFVLAGYCLMELGAWKGIL